MVKEQTRIRYATKPVQGAGGDWLLHSFSGWRNLNLSRFLFQPLDSHSLVFLDGDFNRLFGAFEEVF